MLSGPPPSLSVSRVSCDFNMLLLRIADDLKMAAYGALEFQKTTRKLIVDKVLTALPGDGNLSRAVKDMSPAGVPTLDCLKPDDQFGWHGWVSWSCLQYTPYGEIPYCTIYMQNQSCAVPFKEAKKVTGLKCSSEIFMARDPLLPSYDDFWRGHVCVKTISMHLVKGNFNYLICPCWRPKLQKLSVSWSTDRIDPHCLGGLGMSTFGLDEALLENFWIVSLFSEI